MRTPTLEQLSNYIKKCKQLRKQCDDYMHVPDYYLEKHIELFNIYKKAYEEAQYAYKLYTLIS